MDLKRRHREGAEVSTESLNDIMFFLLLFFLILSTLVNPSVIKLNLPTSKNNQRIEAKPIPLAVTHDHKYYVSNRPVEFSNLEAELQTAIKGIPEPTIVLQFDNDLTVQDMVDVMQIGARLKIKMVIGTKPPNA